jgi:chaperonin GroEL (HSP60 family)
LNTRNAGIALGVDEVVKELTKLSKKISTTQEITQVTRVSRAVHSRASGTDALARAQVGTISANNDFATGEMIARAMEKVGKEVCIAPRRQQQRWGTRACLGHRV